MPRMAGLAYLPLVNRLTHRTAGFRLSPVEEQRTITAITIDPKIPVKPAGDKSKHPSIRDTAPPAPSRNSVEIADSGKSRSKKPAGFGLS